MHAYVASDMHDGCHFPVSILNCIHVVAYICCTHPMGCAGSKHKVKENDFNNQPVARSKAEREFKENFEVDNGAMYTGEFLNGIKDGTGTQKCMSYDFPAI